MKPFSENDLKIITQDYLSGIDVRRLALKNKCRVSSISTALKMVGVFGELTARERIRRTGKHHEDRLKGLSISKNVTDIQWAYIAGIFDGEGTIDITWRKTGAKYSRVAIVQKDIRLLTWIQGTLGTGTVYLQGKQRNSCSVWRIEATRDVYYFLIKVLPFLIVKRETSMIAVEEVRSRYGWMEE